MSRMPARFWPDASLVTATRFPSGCQSAMVSFDPFFTDSTLRAAGSVGLHDVRVGVLEVGHVLVRRVRDPLAVGAPLPAEHGEGVVRERRVVRSVRAHLPQVELAGPIGRGGMPLVREDGEPLVVGAELPGVLLRGRVVRELRDRAGLHVDAIEVVLLGAAAVLREHDALVRAVPGEARAQRARHLTVAHLPRLARREIHHVELHAAGLVPVERDTVALPRNDRQVERRKPAELLERDARLSACGDGHGCLPCEMTAVMRVSHRRRARFLVRWPLQHARGRRPSAHRRWRSARGTRTTPGRSRAGC